MIKDCLEDMMYLKNTRKPETKPPNPDSLTKNMGAGFPTVEQVEQASDLYYGPLKPSHFVAWTCSA